MPTISKMELARCVGRLGAWYMKRARNALYNGFEDDLYAAVPTVFITAPASGPLVLVVCDVDMRGTGTDAEKSVEEEVVEPQKVTEAVPSPTVDNADATINVVREANEVELDAKCDPTSVVMSSEGTTSSPESTCDKCKCPVLEDQVVNSEDTIDSPVSPATGPRYAKTPHEQSLNQLVFEKLRRLKPADASEALLNGHNRNVSDSSTDSTLVDFSGGGSRTHSLTALDLALSTHGIEATRQNSSLIDKELEDVARGSTDLNSDSTNANVVKDQDQTSLDMAYCKLEAYKVAVTSLRQDKETLAKEKDIVLQQAMGVAQELQYELDSIKEGNVQSLKKKINSMHEEKDELKAENTRLCAIINDKCEQLILLESNHHLLEMEHETEQRQYSQLSTSFLRLVRARTEQQEALEKFEKEIKTVRQNLGELAGDCFRRMVRSSLALKDQGIDVMDKQYREICERAPYYIGFNESDITNDLKEESKAGKDNNIHVAGSEAEEDHRSDDRVSAEEAVNENLDEAIPMELPEYEGGRESPETYNIRRWREIEEAEERLLGPLGIAISADGMVEEMKAKEGQLHATQSSRITDTGFDGGLAADKKPLTTGNDVKIEVEDWQNGALEIQSLFQRPKPARFEVLDLPTPGSLSNREYAPRDDWKKDSSKLSEMVTRLTHTLGITDASSESIPIPAETGMEEMNDAGDRFYIPGIGSSSGIETYDLETMAPEKATEKSGSSFQPHDREEFAALAPDHTVPSIQAGAAAGVDGKLLLTPEDEVWLGNVLANVAMIQNDQQQFPDESAASSNFEGEELEDDQDQLFVRDDSIDEDERDVNAIDNAVNTSSDAMESEKDSQGGEEEQDIVAADETERQFSTPKTPTNDNGIDSCIASCNKESPSAASLTPGNNATGTAFSASDCGEHTEMPTFSTQITGPVIGSDRFASVFSFGGRTILPETRSLAEAAAAPIDQNPKRFDFLNALPSSGKANVELRQVESVSGDENLPLFDHRARAKDLEEYTTIIDNAKAQGESSSNGDETQKDTNQNGGPMSMQVSTLSKAFNVPHSQSFDFVLKSAVLPSMLAQMSSFPAGMSKNSLSVHAGFRFSPGFVANASAPSTSTEMQIYRPNTSFSKFAGNSTLSQEKIPSPPASTEATVAAGLPSVPHSVRDSLPDTQSKMKSLENEITDQAKPTNSEVDSPKAKTSTTESKKSKVKATKPKLGVAAAIALEKKVKEEREAAEKKQRELANRQREAAARRRMDAGGKGGRRS